MTYQKEWIAEDKQRVVDMDRWYQLDKRYLKSHKYNGLYTGLAKEGARLDRRDELEKRIANAYDRLRSH